MPSNTVANTQKSINIDHVKRILFWRMRGFNNKEISNKTKIHKNTVGVYNLMLKDMDNKEFNSLCKIIGLRWENERSEKNK